jgi:hypothetical protein
MAKFLIEVYHEPKKVECARAIHIFLKTGSHFLSHADWGCMDGEHKAWMIVDNIESEEEARYILPPVYRPQAKIVRLNKFTIEEADEMLRHHED